MSAKRETSTAVSARRLEAESFHVDGLELVVFELELEPVFPEQFTPAERDVARLLCEGHDTRAIAQRRGSRYRTIANQLASMYRKAAVHSSAELVALLTGADASGVRGEQ
ncbi:MAG: helix-turn-helix transcriptional regulator [Polyangiaceae bacterium]